MTGVHIPMACTGAPLRPLAGSLSRLHSLRLAAWTAARELARRGIDPAGLDAAVLGYSVPQQGAFYGLPWVAGMMGAPSGRPGGRAGLRHVRARHGHGGRRHHAGPGLDRAGADGRPGLQRPQLYHPDPAGPGGSGVHENWVLDNFSRIPGAGWPCCRPASAWRGATASPRPNRTPSPCAATSNTRRPAPTSARPAALHDPALRAARCRLRQDRGRAAGRRTTPPPPRAWRG